MPHIIFEISSNVSSEHPVQNVVDAAHAALLKLDFIPDAGLRTRVNSQSDFAVATGDPSYGFIAVTARIGPGRSNEQKQLLLGTLLDVVEAELGIDSSSDDATTSAGLRLGLSCEVQEIDTDSRVNRNYIRPHMQANTSTP